MADHRTSMGIDICFEKGTVVSPLSGADKFEAIRALIRGAPVFREIADLEEFEASVIERERAQSTGFGRGVAIAHGPTSKVSRVLVGMGISREGIPFEATDGKPVHLLFIIASPPHMNLDYLRVLSALVRCLREQAVRDSLLSPVDVSDIERRMREVFARGLEQSIAPNRGTQACGAAG